MVKASHTAVSCRECDRVQRQIGLIEKAFRGQQPVRLGDRDRRGAEMLQKQPAEVAISDTQAIRQLGNAVGVQRTFGNFPQRA